MSKGDLGLFQESCKLSLTRVQLSKHMVCVVFKKLVDGSWRYTRGFEAIRDLIGV